MSDKGTDDVLYILSRCHQYRWFFVKIGEVIGLRCASCCEPLGIELENINFIEEMIEEDVDDWTFFMPPSRKPWDAKVINKDQGFLECPETKKEHVTFLMKLPDNMKCKCSIDKEVGMIEKN